MRSAEIRALFAASLLAGIAGPLAPARGQASMATEVASAARGVAHVSVMFLPGDRAGGDSVRVERDSSGLVVDPRGLLVTNAHLVAEIAIGEGAPGGEYWLQVLLSNGRTCDARVVARDERLGLALLQLGLEEGELAPSLALPDDAPPPPGTAAVAVGAPHAYTCFASSGVVSAPCGPVALGEHELAPDEVLVCDGALLHEVDGAPLVDASGKVLGLVNTSCALRHNASTDEKDLAGKPDYAFVVTAHAIRGAFANELGAPAESSDAPPAEDAVAALVHRIEDSVVSVWCGAPEERPAVSAPTDPHGAQAVAGLASGVIVDPRGLVITNADAVGDATEVSVLLRDGSSHRGQVLKVMKTEGVALVRLELPEGTSLPAAVLGSSSAALPGETIVVVGNPFGPRPTVSAGVLSALPSRSSPAESLAMSDSERLLASEVEGRLRVGTRVHAGHKGGALVDLTGRVIGIALADIHSDESVLEKLLGDEKRARPESYLGLAVPVDPMRTWFRGEFDEHGTAPSLRVAPEATPEELALRRGTVAQIVESTRDSLLNVEVKAEEARPQSFDPFATAGEFMLLGQGSGVVIDASGLAITNWHVVHPSLGEDGAQREDRRVEVSLPNGKRYEAHVLNTSRDDDLALIRLVLAEGDSVKPVPLGESKALLRGDPVVAIGNPFGKANTVTAGIVAALDQHVMIQGRMRPYDGMLQTDAPINPGNSGGALLDIQGRLVGINSAGRSGAGLAIPVERARSVFSLKLLSTQGLRSPQLGMDVRDSDDADGVVRVAAVERYGPADRAGIEVGDRLVSLDGEAVASVADFSTRLLPAATPWVALRLEIERHGERQTVEALPASHAAWTVFRQTGIELAQVDYAAESELVREASVALHQAYTGAPDSRPRSLMTGALRVVHSHPREGVVLDARPGDLLLGATTIVRTVSGEHTELVRFESAEDLRDHLAPLATKEGTRIECWFLRDGSVFTTPVLVYRVR